MTTQLIGNKRKSYTFTFNEIECTFIQMALYTPDSFLPIKPFVRKNKAILYWKVGGRQISYNQIKKIIK